MKTIYGVLLLFTTIFFTECGSDVQNSNENEVKNQVNIDSSIKEEQDLITAEFVIEYNNNDEMPLTFISVNIKGVKHEVKSISGMADMIKNEQFEEMEIPSNAIAACGGWWAGAGDYFYLIKNDQSFDVYHGWQDEMQEDAGYHWTYLKEITY
jgi:hypothetical protein